MSKLLEDEKVKIKIEGMYEGEYELISEYKRADKEIILRHKPCQTEYEVKRAKSFLHENEGKCPKCYKNKNKNPRLKIDENNIQEEIDRIRGINEFKYISGFTKMKEKVKLLHVPCGNIVEIDPSSLLGKRKRGCKYCADIRRGTKMDDSYLSKIITEGYKWIDKYKGDNKIKHKILHEECGHIYEVRPNDFQQGYRCPKCAESLRVSAGELSMLEFIKSIAPDEEIIHSYRDRLEIDVFMPERKIGFEYNGHYWHSDINRGKDYHEKKMKYFLDKGIKIYFIDEVDWLNKQDIIKDKIKSILGKNERIFARKTLIRKIESRNIEKEFLNNNHIQGYAISSFAFGLYYNDELVSMITFVKARGNLNQKNNNHMELLRYCSLSGYNIIGGFSKLLKHSINYIKDNYNGIDSISTFADLTLSSGNLYEKNNFILSHISKPSYFYIYRNRKYNRYNFRKQELAKKFPDFYKEELTEFQITDSIPGMYRVWNCGNNVYRLTF